jgi:sugar phosphate isomerase/epimerase
MSFRTLRTFRRLTAAALAAGALMLSRAPARADVLIPEEYRTNGFFVGCQAWTWNRFTVFEAIERTAQAGGKVIEFYPGQKLSIQEPTVTWDHNASAETIRKVQDKLAQHNIKAVNYGVVGIPNDAAGARKVFQFAKTLGLRAVTTESVEALDVMEPLVKEFDVMVAIHNHPRQPNNPNYRVWDPNYVLSVVKKRDRRIGACADTGHWVRSGIKPIDALRILRGRVISSHLKDLNTMAPNAHDMPYGFGVSDVPAILAELRRQGFNGNISVEYEHEMDRSMPMVAQCIGYVRGWGQARGLK